MPPPRYPSDLSDEEWVILEPLLPSTKKRGRPPKWPLRRVVDAVFYLLRGYVHNLIFRDQFGAYTFARSKRTSLAPSPSTARNRSSDRFVFWVLRRGAMKPSS
jgi:transposase